MLVVDMLKEYLLIGYLKLLPSFLSKLPKSWEDGEKGTVIIIPGLHETNFFLYNIGCFLNQHGYKIITIPKFHSTEPIVQIYSKLDSLIESLSANNLILLSHSKGGIVAKYFLDNSKHSHKIKYSVSLATPYQGTMFAKLPFHNIYELDPTSTVIKELNANTDHVSKVINIYPKFDNHVIPNKNLILHGAKNIQVDINGHTRILVCQSAYAEIIKALSAK